MQVDEPISPSFGFSSSMELSWPYHIKIFSVRKSVLSRRFIGFIGWILDISLVKLVEFLIRDWFDWLNYAVPLACLLNAACLEFCFILNYFFITVLDHLMSVTTWYDYFLQSWRHIHLKDWWKMFAMLFGSPHYTYSSVQNKRGDPKRRGV